MKCAKCGKELKEFDVVCSHCGTETTALLPPDEVIKPENETVINEEVNKAPQNKKFKLFLTLAIVSVFALLGFFVFLFGELAPKNANFSVSPKAIGDNVFYNSGVNFVSYNLATEETQGSLYLKEGKPIQFALFGNEIYYISNATLYKSDFTLSDSKNKQLVKEGVNAAVIANGLIYYVDENNPSQLKKCDLNGKNDSLVTLIYNDRNPVLELYFAKGCIYALKADKLYCYDIAKQEITLIFENEPEKKVLGVNFFKENGVMLFKDTEVKVKLINSRDNNEYSVEISRAAVCSNNVYGLILSEGNLAIGKVNLKNGALNSFYSLQGYENLKVLSFDADKKYIWLTVEQQGENSSRYGVFRITLNGEATVLHSDLI